MATPGDLQYTKEHEWTRSEGDDIITIGITNYAQEQLGDIVHIELPESNDPIAQKDSFGVVESVKSVSDLYAPINGTIVEVNDALLENPEILNQDCYSAGWMIKMKVSDPKELDALMTADEYEEFIKQGEA